MATWRTAPVRFGQNSHRWVKGGQADGQVRSDVDAQAIAAEYVAYTSGISFLWLLSAETFDFENANNAMKHYLRTTLSPQLQEQS